MKMDFNRKIILEDGSEYEGYGFIKKLYPIRHIPIRLLL